MRTDLLALGVFGAPSRLRERIETLVTRSAPHSRRSRIFCGFFAAALVAFALAAPLTPRWIAFAQQGARPTFEVASVKPTLTERAGDAYGSYFHVFPGGRFTVENMPLFVLITRAYGVDRSRVVAGNWIKSGDRYDIDAQPGNQDPAYKAADAAGPAARQALQNKMLQSLLEDRFKLRTHRETRESSTYALVAAKGGPKLREPSEARPGDGTLRVGKGWLIGQKAPLAMLVKQLSSLLGRTVADETSLVGEFDFKLEWTPDDTPPDLAAGPSLFTAVQEQLGLKLESRKEQAEVLVIDHAEKPDAN